MRFKEIEKIILKDGWIFKKAKGSHHQYIHPTKSGKVTIPRHPGDLDPHSKGGHFMKLTYAACFYPCTVLQGGYTVEVPDLPGCVSQGNDLADAIFMITDAASGWVLDELEDGKDIPKSNPIETIIPKEGGFVSMIALDIDSYAEKYGSKAVRKNLTIPAWLDTFAETNHINFSHVLRDSLTDLYQHR